MNSKAEAWLLAIRVLIFLWQVVKVGYPVVTGAAWIQYARLKLDPERDYRSEFKIGNAFTLALLLTSVLGIVLFASWWFSLPDTSPMLTPGGAQ